MEYAEGGSLYNGMFLFSALQTGKILLVIICKKFCNTLQILSFEVNGYTLRGRSSVIFMYASLFIRIQLL